MDDFRPPVPSDEKVQVTHVDAALAKISCAHLGYFQDPWTEQLMRSSRPAQRSPLIHRGYYSRVAAMRTTASRFLATVPTGRGAQIVNLGSGFDTMYFWLRETPNWREDLTFFEVDFPEVLSKKVSAILKKQALWPLLDAASQEDIVSSDLSSAGTRNLRTKHLRYVPADIRMLPEVTTAMEKQGFRGDVPTLFISECVMVYMQALHGDAIVEWAAAAVPDAPSAMVVYEQFNPNDRFGKVMVDNLMRRGCPLLSIHDYPTLESQRQRYLQRGWQKASAADMNQVYNKYLDSKDVERIQRLEFMDEFEEWHLIQGHYFVLAATRAAAGGEGEDWIHTVSMTPSQEAEAAAMSLGSPRP